MNDTGADYADQAETIDCVGVFDCERQPIGSGDIPTKSDVIARAAIEGAFGDAWRHRK